MTQLLRSRRRWPLPFSILLLVSSAVGIRGQSDAPDAWRQWGGPDRNFMVEATDLGTDWPASGPEQLWTRPLGDGHSSIAFEEGVLYTMYRPRIEQDNEWAEEEVVVALEAATGRTLWEHRYPASPLNFRFGAGPHSTPLIVGDRLFTTGTNKQMYALDKRTGEVLWSHDLVEDFGAPPTLLRPAVKAGYACSPLAYGDTVIVTAGGEGQAVMAFDQKDGSVVWKSGDFNISPASPILIDLEGEEQLVVFGGLDVNGLDPATGELLWSHPHDPGGDMNISTPVWGDDNKLFVSSAYDGGARMLELGRTEDRTVVRELWFTPRLRVHIGTVIRLGNLLVGSSGDFGGVILTAVDATTGEVVWRDRQFSRATFLYADDKLVILDEDGTLALATVSPEGLNVLARASVLTNKAWTVPTLVGTKMYLRDRRTIMALDLSS